MGFFRNAFGYYFVIGLVVLLGLGLGIFLFFDFLRKKPFVATVEGVVLNGDIKISWSEISGIEVYENTLVSSLQGYQIFLKNTNRFLETYRRHRDYKKMVFFNSQLSTPVVLCTNDFYFDDQKFLKVVRYYLNKSKSQ